MPSFSITYHQIGNDQNPLRLVGLEDYILPSYVGILVSRYKDGLKAVSWNVDRLRLQNATRLDLFACG